MSSVAKPLRGWLLPGAFLLLSVTRVAQAELLLFYNFNDPTDPMVALDASENGNDADIFGAEYTPDGEGRTGEEGDRALDFLGPEDGVYIEVSTAIDEAFDTITENDAATITMWLLGGEFQPQNHFVFWFADGDVDPRQLAAHVPWSDGTIYFDVAGCCGATQRLSAPEPDDALWRGEWNHYAFVKEETRSAIYQNGELWLDSGLDLKDPLGLIRTVRFGSGSAPGSRSYNGLMDDIGVWDEALDEDEILDIMENGLAPPGGEASTFRRGDADGNGTLELTDAINNLSFQFLGSFAPPCLDALDWDDSGTIEVTDPVGSLTRQFLGGTPAPPPGSDVCGPDPTQDALDCAAPPSTCG